MSNHSLLERVEMLSDRKAIRILEFYAERLFQGLTTSPEEIIKNVPEAFKGHPIFEFWLNMSRSDSNKVLSETDSILLAKDILRGFAMDSSFAPALEDALNDYHDDKLMAESILAFGIAISMIIVASTTTLEAEIKGCKIEKKEANVKLIETLLKHFPKFSK